MTREQDRTELLARLARGDLTPDDPEVQAAAADDVRLRAHLAALAQTQELLGRTADEEAAAVAAATRDAPDVPAIDVRATLGERVHPRRPRVFDRRLAAAAVLLVAIVAGWFLWQGTDPGPSAIRLGGEIEIATPERAADRRLLLHWSFANPRVVRYAASLREPDEPRELAAAPRLPDPRWLLDPDTADRLPAKVRLQVQAFDAAGDPIGDGEALLTLPR